MFSSYVSPLAEEYVGRVLRSGMLSEGSEVRKFEEEFEQTFCLKTNSFVAVNSGTSALHLALEIIEKKGEVLLPANTFIATGLAVLYANCVPVFCDIQMDGTIDPDDVLRKITKNTVAVIGVNWAGKECLIDDLELICKKYGLYLIIDAAQSLGCRTSKDITCFSFQATKHLTTGDGGGLVCKDGNLYQKAKDLRWFGISKSTKTGLLGERVYNLDTFGYKYHMNDFAAALGRANLVNIKAVLFHYKTLARTYIQNLNTVQSVHPFLSNNSYWAYPVRVNDVYSFSKFCREKEIPCSIIHRGIDHNSIFGGVNDSLKNQDIWEKTVTHLPIHASLSINDVMQICSKVNDYAV